MKPGNTFTQEAINFFTVQTVAGLSGKKMEHLWHNLSAAFDFPQPLLQFHAAIAQALNTDPSTLEQTYTDTAKGFAKLDTTDIIVKKGAPDYPELLLKTNEAPPYLFMRGNTSLLREKIVAIVGTRNPSAEGQEKAYRLAKLFSKSKIVVASGLAKGIDAAAHLGSLENGGLTIAVIGTPLTMAYPKENASLQKSIAEAGLVISQFSPAASVQRWHFPMRNAVMSGISLATVIIEAGETSGALIQADYALKQGRTVFIPQSALENDQLEWPKKYLKRPGAKKFAKIDELLRELEKTNIIERTDVTQLGIFNESICFNGLNRFDEEDGAQNVPRPQ